MQRFVCHASWHVLDADIVLHSSATAVQQRCNSGATEVQQHGNSVTTAVQQQKCSIDGKQSTSEIFAEHSRDITQTRRLSWENSAGNHPGGLAGGMVILFMK